MKLASDPEETKSDLYQDVEKHSDGMISFTYRPPTSADVDALKSTKTYQNWLRERSVIVPDSDRPISQE